MKILSDSVTMNASHSASTNHSVKETLRAWIGDRRPNFEAMEKGLAPNTSQTRTSISAAGLNLSNMSTSIDAAPAQSSADVEKIEEDSVTDPSLHLLKSVVEMMTGKKIRLISSSVC